MHLCHLIIDNSLLQQGTTGKILPKPLYLQQQDHASDVAVSAPMCSSSTTFVLWLPTRDQATAADTRQVRPEETAKDEEHMRPANNRMLFLGWTCLKTLKQASRHTGHESAPEHKGGSRS